MTSHKQIREEALYLNAEQNKIYHVKPPGTARQVDDDGDAVVWALPKALYGGRQAGRHWYKLLRKWFLEHGFTVSEWDPCLFVKATEKGFHYVGVYVDDLVHVYTDDEGRRSSRSPRRRLDHGPVGVRHARELGVTTNAPTKSQGLGRQEVAQHSLGSDHRGRRRVSSPGDPKC